MKIQHNEGIDFRRKIEMEGKKTSTLSHYGVHCFMGPTDDKGLFGLCSMFVVPRRAASGVDGSFRGS